MLQQTQVDRVLPKYHEWLEKYPSFEALAQAPEREVTETWYPLGYNIRPKRLQAIAREAVANYGGKLPSDEATLLSFKGIGAYTAGAIRSFAFRERAAILDTNVARVLFRVFVGRGAPKAHATKKHLWSISATLVPQRRAFDFNQALMDFGATLVHGAKAEMPDLSDGAAVRGVSAQPEPRRRSTKIHEEHEEPRRARRSDEGMTERIVVVAAVIEQNGRFLVAKRLEGTHLAGCWEFPGGKVHDGETHGSGARPRDCRRTELRDFRPARNLQHRARVSRTHGGASLLSGRAHRSAAGRCSDRSCAGSRATSSRSLEFPPADAELISRADTRPPLSRSTISSVPGAV